MAASVPASDVYVTRAIPESALARLRAALPDLRIELYPEDRPPSPEELVAGARGCQALICTLADRIDAALLEALAPTLRVVSTYAVGFENIDLEAARARGVRVAHTPGVLTDATAELAVALLLDCARRVSEGDRLTRRGEFRGWKPLLHRGRSLFGRTVGLVGAGRIAWRVARTLRHGFDCEILVHAPAERAGWRELGARFVDLTALLEASDFVSLHCPLTPETRHLIDERALSRMQPHAMLVNTARGAVVDEAALVSALREGRIAGAGLDVYEHEPALSPGLAELENVVLAPHIGSATFEARDAMGRLCVDAVIAVLSGEEPEHVLV